MKLLLCACLAALAGAAAGAAEDNTDPKRPFKESARQRKDARPGWILLSDNTVIEGVVFTTLGKPITIFDRAEKEHARLDWEQIARVDVAVEKDVLERDWRWKESGSDVKVYTDLYYVWHKYLTTITLKDGEKIAGDVAAPIYIVPEGKEERQRFILHKRNKGDKAEKDDVAEPVYISKLVLTDLPDAEQPPEPEVKEDNKEEQEE